MYNGGLSQAPLVRPWITIVFLVCGALMLPAQSQQPSPISNSVVVAKKNRVETASPPASTWQNADVGSELAIHDRLRTGDLSQASVRLTDLSVLQIDELTTIEILAPRGPAADKPALDVKAGQLYFFSRDKPREIQLQTPVATGALRGTEFHLQVGRGGRTLLTMLDGEIELKNKRGSVVVHSGEQGLVEPGGAPTKTAVIISSNIIQWCLYYPGLLDADSLRVGSALHASLAAYRDGDLLEALKLYQRDAGRGSGDERAYHASLLLAVGRVPEAEAELVDGGRYAGALGKLIAAVKFQEYRRTAAPVSGTEWLAESYYRQSRSDLTGALAAAEQAVTVAPKFGFAWVRLANLQFGFGRVREAARALQRGHAFSSRNPQAAALAGYFATAENHIEEAAAHFDEALAIDGFLGNAWLGRGLCKIRRGRAVEGRKDLQVAAAMEPNRALLHSYLGKAFSNAADNPTAERELGRSKAIDPNDPTSWLYSALLDKQEHEFNHAVDDLRESLQLNDNRRLYRSTLLLDQDRAVRNANLAAIYQEDGLTDLSLRVASRGVDDDYANASAHLFLANSYNALRDPRRILLRYDTPFFNELLLANLLAPVGGGPLSQNVSDQEYSKLFEQDRLGASTNTVYLSTGSERELASQFGQFGNFSYAVDLDYESDRGTRPNNHLDRLEIYSQAKYQLGLQDSLFFQTKYQDNRSGDVFPYYDQNAASRSLAFKEKQEPLAFVGYHHEWAPGVHTLMLVSRLPNDQTTHLDDASRFLFDLATSGQRALPHFFDVTSLSTRLDYHSEFTIYAGELSQIWQTERNTLVAGGRVQAGTFDTSARLFGRDFNLVPPDIARSNQAFETDYWRYDIYCYDTFRPFRSLSFTVGISYDNLLYPTNYRNAPLLDTETSTDRWSPKVGLIWKPWTDSVLRVAYTRSLGGVSLEDSVRIEPTLVGGFNQALRTLIPESIAGTVDAARDNRLNLGVEHKFGRGTYLAAEGNVFWSDVDRNIGIFERTDAGSIVPAGTKETLRYNEKNLLLTANQLVGAGWSIGSIYTVSKAELDDTFPDVIRTGAPGFRGLLRNATATSTSGVLQVERLFVLYNDPSGFFARAETLWAAQDSDGYSRNPQITVGRRTIALVSELNGADFWQFNIYGGYRFPRNIGDITIGLLNLTDRDYRLNPLNEYAELPRTFTISVQTRLNF